MRRLQLPAGLRTKRSSTGYERMPNLWHLAILLSKTRS